MATIARINPPMHFLAGFLLMKAGPKRLPEWS